MSLLNTTLQLFSAPTIETLFLLILSILAMESWFHPFPIQAFFIRNNEKILFLCIGDTMATKFGRTFEDVSKLFDHASHNESNYLNGHCFVTPTWVSINISIHPIFLLILICHRHYNGQRNFNTSHVSINLLRSCFRNCNTAISVHPMFLLIPLHGVSIVSLY